MTLADKRHSGPKRKKTNQKDKLRNIPSDIRASFPTNVPCWIEEGLTADLSEISLFDSYDSDIASHVDYFLDDVQSLLTLPDMDLRSPENARHALETINNIKKRIEQKRRTGEALLALVEQQLEPSAMPPKELLLAEEQVI